MVDGKEIADLPSPYQELHIYLVSGLDREEDEAALGEGFVERGIEGETKMDALMRSRPDLSLLEEHRFSYEEWQGARLDPVRVDDFLIVPPWDKAEAGKGEIRDDFSKKEGLILSGLLRSQARNIEAKLSGYHLESIRLWEYEETWYTMLVKGNARDQSPITKTRKNETTNMDLP